jgi:hypothetical protein
VIFATHLFTWRSDGLFAPKQALLTSPDIHYPQGCWAGMNRDLSRRFGGKVLGRVPDLVAAVLHGAVAR